MVRGCILDFGKISAIVMKSNGIDTVVTDGSKYPVDAISQDMQFSSMICYVANCLSAVTMQAYILPYDVYKMTEQVTGYDVELAGRYDSDSYPVNLRATDGFFVPVAAYIVEKMGVRNGNEINFDNLTGLFRQLVQATNPGQKIGINAFSLMLMSMTCPDFMKGVLPAVAPSLFPQTELEDQERGMEVQIRSELEANPFLSGADQVFDNSDVLGL